MRAHWLVLPLLLLPSAASPQVGIQLGAGLTVPVGQYAASGAGAGWTAHARLRLPIQPGLDVTAGLLAGSNPGSNPHDSDLYGPEHSSFRALLAGMLYRIGRPTKPGAFLFWEAGWARQATSYADDSFAESSIGYTAGVGLAIPVSNPVDLEFSGSYFGMAVDTRASFWSLCAGVRLRLGASKD